jgi:hypothetical protein
VPRSSCAALRKNLKRVKGKRAKKKLRAKLRKLGC